MISVENFYWIIFQNLLEKTGLSLLYFYPFGTRENLSINEFKKNNYQRDVNHVVFHDQEPFYDFNFGLYDTQYVDRWTNRFCKIFANSEHSDLKKQYCKKHGFIDWYYFYHGFAALDWYRDTKFLHDHGSFSKIYSSMSHLCRHRRSYRMALTARFIENNLDKFGDISLHAKSWDVDAELNDIQSFLSESDKINIDKNLRSIVPLTADVETLDGMYSAHCGHKEYKFWQNSLWHVVNETIFFEDKKHLTEKIFKPIVALRPFILTSSAGNLSYLRSYGFQTFGTWIDESYDQEESYDLRLDKIVSVIKKLCDMPINQLREMHKDMMPVLAYNKSHFFTEFKQIIVNELVDNFQQCINIWNNGRVDGKNLPPLANINQVKQILLS